MPPETPDICVPSVNKCPESSNPEIRGLCERGVANLITDLMTNTTYWNQFCAECHGVELTEYEATAMPEFNNGKLVIDIYHYSYLTLFFIIIAT